MRLLVWVFVTIPSALVIAGIFFAIDRGWGPSFLDVGMSVVMYTITCAGIGVGFHRYFTHGAFKANRRLRIALGYAGSLAGQGEIVQWVADHRRHHAFSDKEGDPHSPWLFGTTFRAVARGFWHAHMGWLYVRELSNRARFAPDLEADDDIRRIDRRFPLIVTFTFLAPAFVGGLVTLSWQGALSGLFWAGIVRFAFLHHVTWSINSICHMVGDRPFASRDKAANFWPLAIFSFGESWHNLHHADPTCARHGVDKGQIDINAWFIRRFEKRGWATKVRWPNYERLAAKRTSQAA
jgi:stearoyl-CoA desaturase (delta-9 desaturase)